MAAKKSGLGRGLGALFSDNVTEEGSSVEVRLSEIEPNRNQPRKDFDESALADLSESIEKHGLIQPILVRPMPAGGYQIIAGERRWRACRMAKLVTVPVIIRDMDDTQAMEIALIENLQREDLNPVEEALGYKSLIEEYGMTQETAAVSVGKSRPAVANSLRLLGLDADELTLVRSGEISAGHGRTLLSINDTKSRKKAVELAKGGASVRELEKLSKSVKAPKYTKRTPKKDNYFTEFELTMREQLGRKIKVNAKGKGGSVEIEFFDKKDLGELAKLLIGKGR